MRNEVAVAQPVEANDLNLTALANLRRSYRCQCGSMIFFRNSFCLHCHMALGYEPFLGIMLALQPDRDDGVWIEMGRQVRDRTVAYRRCANLHTAAACNWLIPLRAGEYWQSFCVSCRLNRTIPDLNVAENQVLWGNVECAKRRVISALLAFGLPVKSKITEDVTRGMAFDILRANASIPKIMTGHDEGLITLNLEEADDAKREQIRRQMHEPYRTLVGHLRHEVGHYYWERLVAGTSNTSEFREVFGDERLKYDDALKEYYSHGPRQDWAVQYITAYASAHPWEDWAESWAHYMHMLDTLSTASSFGLSTETIHMPFLSFDTTALWSGGRDQDNFLQLINSWFKLTAVLNELCRGMGQPDFYPFVLPANTILKLHYIHSLIRQSAEG